VNRVYWLIGRPTGGMAHLYRLHVQPDGEAETWSVPEEHEEIANQDRVGDPARAVPQHNGPWSRIQIAQTTCIRRQVTSDNKVRKQRCRTDEDTRVEGETVTGANSVP